MKRKPGKAKRGPNVGGGEHVKSESGQIGDPRCEIAWPMPVARLAASVPPSTVTVRCRKKGRSRGVFGAGALACDDCRKVLTERGEF